ncbi:MAG: nucleoside 2-deoxyribosyltransferase, partial [Bacteroidales bacterium]
MRIYLACTVRGDRAAIPILQETLARLEQYGHEVFTGHLLRDDVEEFEAALPSIAVYERDVRWLHACDVVVAEASGSSYGVGFEVGYVLGRSDKSGQRVFLLYDSARRPFISRLIPGNTHPNCVSFGYRDAAEVRAFIDHH